MSPSTEGLQCKVRVSAGLSPPGLAFSGSKSEPLTSMSAARHPHRSYIMEKLRKITKACQNSRCIGRDSNLVPSENKSTVYFRISLPDAIVYYWVTPCPVPAPNLLLKPLILFSRLVWTP